MNSKKIKILNYGQIVIYSITALFLIFYDFKLYFIL